MSRLSLQTKFILLALLIFMLAALLSVVMALQLNQLVDNEIDRAQHAQSYDTGTKKLLGANVQFKIQVQEWKNILLRGHVPTDFAQAKASFDEQALQVQQLLAEAKDLLSHTAESAADITKLQQEHQNLTTQYLSALEKFDQNNPDAGRDIDAQVRGVDREFTHALEQKARDVTLRSMMQMQKDSDNTRADIDQTKQNHLIRMTCGLAVLVLILWFFYRHIMQQIGGDPEQARQLATQIVAGDLTVHIDHPAPNSILDQLQQMCDWLTRSIIDLRDSSRKLSLLSQQVQKSAAAVLLATEQQAKAIEQNSTTLEQISATVAQNAIHAQRLERLISPTAEMQNLSQEIIYASKEQTQSIQLATNNLLLVARSSDKNTATAKRLSETAMRLAAEAENIQAVFEAFKTD